MAQDVLKNYDKPKSLNTLVLSLPTIFHIGFLFSFTLFPYYIDYNDCVVMVKKTPIVLKMITKTYYMYVNTTLNHCLFNVGTLISSCFNITFWLGECRILVL